VRQFEWKLGIMLVYDQPITQTRSGKLPTTQPAALDLLALSRLLWHHKAMIVSAALICACAAVAIGKSLTPRYTATAQLYVDPRELQLVDRELTPRAQDVSGLSMVVESQARLITSNSVLLPVIQNTRLDKDPEFGGGDARGALSGIIGVFGLEPRQGDGSKPDLTPALDALNRHITIRKTERSFVVDVEVWSIDREKAAMLANAIATAYLAESRNSQASAARRATNDLSSRLKELQQKLRDAETALATYKAQNNFVGTQDTLLSDQQLSASNQRLAAAHAASLDAKAKYDQIEASRRAATDPGAIVEALQSPTIANLRSQYADARKRYAELAVELGPLHPALKQTEKQVEDLRRTINEEVDRVAQSAKNELTRARDYEASLNKALETQKRQSVQLGQASVRLRELERDVEASRDVYQSFLKRSRETEEQESLNTSAARVIGEATVPQRRSFPPAMSLLAAIGFMLGAFAAAARVVVADRLAAESIKPADADARPVVPARKLSSEQAAGREPSAALVEKPAIARLQECDVMRTLGGILGTKATADVTRFGWPTLRPGSQATTLLNTLRGIRAAVARRSSGEKMPVIAVIGMDQVADRCLVSLNFALAAARDGVNVLMIDADHRTHKLSNRTSSLGKTEAGRRGWLSIGNNAARAIKTANGISILPGIAGGDLKPDEAIRKSLARARATGGHDLAVLDGPALPFSAADRKLLEEAHGIVAVLPLSLDINDAMEEIIAALGPARHKLAGVILDELNPQVRQRGQRHA
jgi:polysaccharide biosynthesis transport protein